MRILDRYLLREFVAYLLVALLAFIGIFIIVNVFEKIDKFIDNSTPIGTIIAHYVYYTPFVFVRILPVAMLLASLMALGRFARQHELTAALMAGQSLFRIYGSVLGVAFAVSLFALYLEQGVVPEANFRRYEIFQYEIKQKPRPTAKRQRNIRHIGVGGRIYLINSYDPERAIMRGVVIQEFANDTLARRIDAVTGVWKDDHWELSGVTERTFAGDSLTASNYPTLRLDVADTPEDFARQERDPEHMGFAELRTYIRRLELSGAEVSKRRVDLYTKIAYPFSGFITVLIGASLSTRIRKGGMAVGVGLSLAISVIYYCSIQAGQALGHAGTLPPLLAAWIANLLFGAIGLTLFLRAQGGR